MGHGLGLGRIPFSKSYSPYTPVERRRRGNRSSTVGPLKLKAARSDLPSGRPNDSVRNEASILPDDLSPVGLTFLIAADQERSHVLGQVILCFSRQHVDLPEVFGARLADRAIEPSLAAVVCGDDEAPVLITIYDVEGNLYHRSCRAACRGDEFLVMPLGLFEFETVLFPSCQESRPLLVVE